VRTDDERTDDEGRREALMQAYVLLLGRYSDVLAKRLEDDARDTSSVTATKEEP